MKINKLFLFATIVKSAGRKLVNRTFTNAFAYAASSTKLCLGYGHLEVNMALNPNL